MAAVLAAIIGYLIGTFPTAVLVARWVGRRRQVEIDPLQHGTRNPGGANMIRLTGKGWGVFVIAVDTFKGVAGVCVGAILDGDAAMAAGGIAATVGHILPVWTRFRGGKGVGAAGGAFLAGFPGYFGFGSLLIVIVRVLTHSGLVAIFASLTADVLAGALWWAFDWPNPWGIEPGPILFVFALSLALVQAPKFLLDARHAWLARTVRRAGAA